MRSQWSRLTSDPGRRDPRGGGVRRPQQRARDLLRQRGQRPAGVGPAAATTSCRWASRREGRWVLEARRARPADDHRRPTARGGRQRHAVVLRRRTRPGAAARSTRPGSPRSCWPTWTSCSRCCTGPGARTAPSRACSRWPGSRTSGQRGLRLGGGDGQGAHEGAVPRGGLPIGRYEVITRPAVAGGPRTGAAADRGGWACRSSSSRRAPARRLGITQVDGRRGPGGGDRGGPQCTTRASSWRPPSRGPGRSSAACSPTWTAPPAPASAPRSGSVGATSSTTSRRSTSTTPPT